MSEDFDIDDLRDNIKKKKRNSKSKGDRGALEICKLLTARFGKEFTKTPASGARWAQVRYQPHFARLTTSGDIVNPTEDFRFTIECKHGYDHIDFRSIFDNGSTDLDAFLEQVTNDSNRTAKEPLLVWRSVRKPWLAFVRSYILSEKQFKYKMTYREWTCVSLEEFLKLEDGFFHNNPCNP